LAQIIAAAGVRPITPHGLRHTTATLLLGAGVPVQVVAQRLGHSDVTMTLNTYAHALPDAQRDAADRLAPCCRAAANELLTRSVEQRSNETRRAATNQYET